MSILNHFKGTPREEQRKVLLEVEASWAQHDVFVLRMPVGAGKSRVLKCITEWAGGGALLTPTNLLVRQYTSEFEDLEAPRPRSEFGPSAWADYLREWRRRQTYLANYYSYLALRAYKPLVCFDEAHNLVPFLQEKEEVKVWANKWPFPAHLRTASDLRAWAEHVGHSKLVAALDKDPDNYMLRYEILAWRGKPTPCVRLLPLTPQENRPILWPRQVKKLVLASATLDEEDVKDLGLENRRVRYVDSGSPIPVAQRPVLYRPAARLTREGQAAGGLEALAKALQELAAANPTRGLVHVTYALAEGLAPLLAGNPRFLFHDSANKARVFGDWLRSPDRILVGAGLTEGIDLAGDKARWQAICKILFPDKSDPAVYAKAQLRPRWYVWSAVRDLLQASGRICRGPEDYGVTYILDSAFETLYNKNRTLFPAWFRGALT